MIGPTFETSVTQFEGGSLIVVRGDIDAKTAPRLEAVLVDFGATHVLVDLDAVDFIDSSGLRALARARAHLESSGGRLVLCVHGTSSVVRTIRLAGLDSDFEMVATREDFFGGA